MSADYGEDRRALAVAYLAGLDPSVHNASMRHTIALILIVARLDGDGLTFTEDDISAAATDPAIGAYARQLLNAAGW